MATCVVLALTKSVNAATAAPEGHPPAPAVGRLLAMQIVFVPENVTFGSLTVIVVDAALHVVESQT